MWSFRRTRIVTCPETHEAAAVTGRSAIHSCSGWPEREGCDQACLKQIREARDGCLMHTLVAACYEGKTCVECGRAIEGPAAIRLLDGTSHEWGDFQPQDLPSLFDTAEALCWQCNNVKELEHLRPELIVHRDEMPAAEERLPSPSRGLY